MVSPWSLALGYNFIHFSSPGFGNVDIISAPPVVLSRARLGNLLVATPKKILFDGAGIITPPSSLIPNSSISPKLDRCEGARPVRQNGQIIPRQPSHLREYGPI